MAWIVQGTPIPYSATTAASCQLTAWTCDPTMAPATPGISSGFIYFCRAYVDQNVASTHAYFCLIGAGNSGLTNSFIGVYQPGVGGNLLAQTADLSSTLMTAPSAPLQFTFSSSPSSSIAAMGINTEIWLAILFGAQGTTQPTFVGRSSYGTNIGMSSDYRMWMTNSAGNTSLPSTVPALISASTSGQSIPFIGIGP